jgi:hypothetical protein
MADEDIRIESAAGELNSGISRSSVIMMEAAYLPESRRQEEPGSRFFRTLHACRDEEIPGPDGRVYITKISTGTPWAVARGIRGAASGEGEDTGGNSDVHTVVFYINIRPNEPSTTRFVNATVSIITNPYSKILTFAPHAKETMAGIIGSVGDTIRVSPVLEFRAAIRRYERDDTERRFEVYVGPEEKICFTYGSECGFLFPLPGEELLEYAGMPANGHGVIFDVYPPMPPHDREMPGGGGHAIVSLILEVPRGTPPEFIIQIRGRTKGEIWGVVPLEGRVHFLNPPAS